MKLGSTRPTSESTYLTEVIQITGGTQEKGIVRNVQYDDDAVHNGSGTAQGGAGEDVLIYFIRAWNEDNTTGYIDVFEDMNNHKGFQGNSSGAHSMSIGEPNFYFDAQDDVFDANDTIMPPSGNYKDMQNGMKLTYKNNGNTNISGLTDGTAYYARVRDANEIYLYANQETAKTDTEVDNNIAISDGTQGQIHYFQMYDNDFRTFRCAIGPDDISADQSPVCNWEWVFPHPLLVRNGFGVKVSDGVNVSIGYRNLGQSTPVRDAHTGAPLDGEVSEQFKQGLGETVLRAGLNYGNDTEQFTNKKTEVWGIQGINAGTDSESYDRTTTIYDTASSPYISSGKIAQFGLSRTVESGSERGAAMLGPLNFDPPLLCEKGLALNVPTGCQVMVLYRQIE